MKSLDRALAQRALNMREASDKHSIDKQREIAEQKQVTLELLSYVYIYIFLYHIYAYFLLQ